MSKHTTDELIAFVNRERDTEPNPRRDEFIDAIIAKLTVADELVKINKYSDYQECSCHICRTVCKYEEA